jgi:uncharacterized damage-inducible protein DinB
MRALLCRSLSFLLLAGLTAGTPVPSIAQNDAASRPAASAPTSGARAEFLNELKIQEDKFVQLGQAIPANKYTWRPAEGVRSISEVFLHVAAANFNVTKVIGVPPPPGFKVQGFDKSTTDKAKIIPIMQDAFAHMRQAVISMPDSDLEKQVDWFGAKNTYRGILLFVLRHNAEHLGQAIAYARMNGVVPPWTEEQQAQQKKPQEKPKQ